MRLSGTKTGAVNQYRGLGNQLWDLAGNRPSLDLPFSDTKSLVDATTGTNLVDFARASSGTYVGSDGLIKTATTNYLTWSEDWSQIHTENNTTITVNDTTAPDGAVTADKITATTTGDSNSGLRQKLATIPVNTETYTVSWFVKRGNTDSTFLQVAIVGGTFIAVFGVIDWTQSPVTFTFNGLSGSPVYTIHPLESKGDGWYRVAISITNNNTGNAITSRIYASDRLSTVTGDYVYTWGAQVEQSSTVGEYIPTTSTINSAPRFDHDPTTGESLGLLVEESRANLVTHSGDLGNVAWVAADGASRPGVTVTAPDGTDSAIQLNVVSTGTSRLYQTVSVTSGATYTLSVYMRVASGTLAMKLGNIDVGTYKSVSVTDEWQRFEVTQTASSDPRLPAFASDNADGSVYIWGAQLEEGSFPTSYIPTEGTTVTRSADVASISSANFSSWYNASEGTMFAGFRDSLSTSNEYPFAISDNTTLNRFAVFTSGSSTLNSRLISANTNFSPGDTSFTASSLIKISITGKIGTDQAITACSGVLSSANSPSSMPAVDRMYIGSAHNGTQQLNGTIRRLCYWPQRLPNSTLQTITQ